MEQTPKEMLKAYVDSQKFNSTTEIMDAMKEMFRDVLQQVMESELDTELGYEKSQRSSEMAVENKPRNYRNGHSKKTVKTQLEAVEVKVPRDRNGEYEPQIIAYNVLGAQSLVRCQRDKGKVHMGRFLVHMHHSRYDCLLGLMFLYETNRLLKEGTDTPPFTLPG